MTPTHILVPIDLVEDLMEYSPKSSDILDSYPKVDLSEEGIKASSYNCIRKLYLEDKNDKEEIVVQAYQQCAKDLLNTK
jgi:hypothetical protein